MPDPVRRPDELLATLERGSTEALAAVAAAGTLEELAAVESAILGRRSPVASVQRALGGLEPGDRRRVGLRTNEAREGLREAVAARRRTLDAERDRAVLEADRIDLTLPGRRPRPGSLHPLTIVQDEIADIF